LEDSQGTGWKKDRVRENAENQELAEKGVAIKE
jgi:hypothetical protein